MFKNPAISVGVVGWFVWGAMDLARTVEYAVQAGWSLIVSFIWLLPLTGLRATESGVDCGVIDVITIASAFVSAASKLAAAIFGIRSAVYLTWTIEYAVQTRRARIVSFVWLLPLIGLRATEFGIDRRVFGVITVVLTLMSVASGLAVAVSGFRSARVACIIVATG